MAVVHIVIKVHKNAVHLHIFFLFVFNNRHWFNTVVQKSVCRARSRQASQKQRWQRRTSWDDLRGTRLKMEPILFWVMLDSWNINLLSLTVSCYKVRQYCALKECLWLQQQFLRIEVYSAQMRLSTNWHKQFLESVNL